MIHRESLMASMKSISRLSNHMSSAEMWDTSLPDLWGFDYDENTTWLVFLRIMLTELHHITWQPMLGRSLYLGKYRWGNELLCETSSTFADNILRRRADKRTFYGGYYWIRSLDTAELYLSSCSLRFDWLRFRHFIWSWEILGIRKVYVCQWRTGLR